MSSTEVYSSGTEEPSESDNCSINSVIYVERVDADADIQLSGCEFDPPREELPDTNPPPPQTGDSETDTESDIDGRNCDTDSSSSSEGTQV